jgi:hypothetical protein
MTGLAQIYALLDEKGCPGCTRRLIEAVYRATQKGSRIKMSREAFENGTDSRPAREHGILRREDDGGIAFTAKARGMIQ